MHVLFLPDSYILQIGDLKGFYGLFMVQMQQLRKKLKVLDFTYGHGTGYFYLTQNLFKYHV